MSSSAGGELFAGAFAGPAALYAVSPPAVAGLLPGGRLPRDGGESADPAGVPIAEALPREPLGPEHLRGLRYPDVVRYKGRAVVLLSPVRAPGAGADAG